MTFLTLAVTSDNVVIVRIHITGTLMPNRYVVLSNNTRLLLL